MVHFVPRGLFFPKAVNWCWWMMQPATLTDSQPLNPFHPPLSSTILIFSPIVQDTHSPNPSRSLHTTPHRRRPRLDRLRRRLDAFASSLLLCFTFPIDPDRSSNDIMPPRKSAGRTKKAAGLSQVSTTSMMGTTSMMSTTSIMSTMGMTSEVQGLYHLVSSPC
jgi:hypothetical protein